MTVSTIHPMFTERELLIMSYAVDFLSVEAREDDRFFSAADGRALCDKIHNVLRAICLQGDQQ